METQLLWRSVIIVSLLHIVLYQYIVLGKLKLSIHRQLIKEVQKN